MQSRCGRNIVQVSSRNSCEEGVLEHMTNHYRRILNAKKSVDTSPPYCYQARRHSGTCSPTKTSSMINSKNCRTYIGCNVSPSPSARSQSANSYRRSCCMRTTPYVSSSRYHAACVAGGTIAPVLVTCVDMDLLNCITYDTKNGPAAYCDKGWEEVKATSNNRKFLPSTSVPCGKIKPCKAKENFTSQHKLYNARKIANQTGKPATVTKEKKPGQRRAVSPKEGQAPVNKDQKLPKRLPFSAEEKVAPGTKNQKLPKRLPFSAEANLAPVSRGQEPQKVPAAFSEEKLSRSTASNISKEIGVLWSEEKPPLSPAKNDSKESRKLLFEEKIPPSVTSSHFKQKRSLSTEEKLALRPERNDSTGSHLLGFDEKIPPSVASTHSKQKRSLSTEEKLALPPEKNDSMQSHLLGSDEKIAPSVASTHSKQRRSLSTEEKLALPPERNASMRSRLGSDEKVYQAVVSILSKDRRSLSSEEKQPYVTASIGSTPRRSFLSDQKNRQAVESNYSKQRWSQQLEEKFPEDVATWNTKKCGCPLMKEKPTAAPRESQMEESASEKEDLVAICRDQEPQMEAPFSEEERPASVRRGQEPQMQAPFLGEERPAPVRKDQKPQKVPLSSSEEKLPRSTPSSNSKESGVLLSEEKLPLSPAKNNSKENNNHLSEKILYSAARSRPKQKRSLSTEDKLALPPERSDFVRYDEKVYRGKPGRVFKEKRSLSSEEKLPPGTVGNDSTSRRIVLSEEKIPHAVGSSYSQQMRTFSKAEKLHQVLLKNNPKQSYPHCSEVQDKRAHDTVRSHPKSKYSPSPGEKSSHIVPTNRSTSSKQKGKTERVHSYVSKDSQCTCSSTCSSEQERIPGVCYCHLEKDPRARCYQNVSADSLEENLTSTDKVRTRSKSSNITSPNLSTSSKTVKNEVESKLRSSRVYHPPRRRSRAKVETESFRPTTGSLTSTCKCMTICICGSDEMEGSRKESQTSSRDSAYNGGVASLPDSRSPTPDKSYKKSDREDLERYVKETEEEEEGYPGSLIESPKKAADGSDIVSEKAESVIDDDQEVLITEKDYDNFSSKIESPKEAGLGSRINFKAKPEDLKRQKEVPKCDFEIKSENAKPNRESLREIKEETMYLRFIQNITSEIIEKCLYTNKSLNKVMKRHFINNLQTLNKERMVKEVNNLRIRLGVPEDKSFLDLDVGVVDSAADMTENYQQLLSDSAFVVPSDLITPMDFLPTRECFCEMENENEEYVPCPQDTAEKKKTKEPSSQVNFVHEIIHYPLQQGSSVKMGLPMVKMKTISHSDDFGNTESRERGKTFEAWEMENPEEADLGFSIDIKGDPNSRDWALTNLEKKSQRVSFGRKKQIRKNTIIDEQGSENLNANNANL